MYRLESVIDKDAMIKKSIKIFLKKQKFNSSLFT